jgi:antibiotic biosynthesis monooxygenase (ABM) superfamily enzyme
MEHDVKMQVLKAAPPLLVSTSTVFGIPLQDWVFIVTIVYTLFQLYYLLKEKLVRPWLSKRRQKKRI